MTATQTAATTQASRSSKPLSDKPKNVKNNPRSRKRARHDSPEPEPEPVAAPPKRVRGKQGKLQGLMNMPVDIFAEIAIYLHPIDLIFLARANKFFRQILMSRSFINVWRSAEGNVDGLPPCPKELCEPQYAALVFTKHCSICGDPALRPMDPILQVRLCVRCRDQQAVETSKVTDPTLVFSSRSLVPGKSRWYISWCLYDDARAIKDKLNTLEHENNQEETERWKKERRDVVIERSKNAQPLIAYLKGIEDEHDTELSGIRKKREVEVKSRLLELGWDKRDIEVWDRAWRREWKSLACIAKPLTERGWENILPTLVAYLELNRDRRLQRERERRQRERQNKLFHWVNRVRDRLCPFIQAHSVQPSEDQGLDESLTSGPSDTGMELKHLATGNSKPPSALTLRIAFPCNSEIVKWEAFKTLVETDTSLEDFDQALESSRTTLDSLALGWIKDLEKALVNLLPNESDGRKGEPDLSSSTQIASLIPEYTPTLGTGQPITNLPPKTRRLLRADSVFARGDLVYFYSDDFHGTLSDRKNLIYHTKANAAAKALLSQLGLPNATYLQLKAAGSVFTCGRCEANRLMSWKSIIQHYVDELLIYESARKNPRVRSSSIKYVFMHDVDVVMPVQPLVKVVTTEEQIKFATKDYGRSRQCLVCKSVGINYYRAEISALDHIRNVHQIENPQQEQHYR
ncbi:hypothetical protein FRC12_003992 [Ceratobasidium sp. 428]|nr:hypothetical protein FRC12_003992 [Ceratobasidium sp. 428]